MSSSCNSDSTTEKIGKSFAYCLILLFSLAGNNFIAIIVYKTKTMRKPINFLIVNMAMSDMLFQIFVIPREIQMLYTDSWLIGGPLGQTLCKLVYFLQNNSITVSIQSLVLITVDRFGAVVLPLRPPLISSKLCPFFILSIWIVAMAVNSPFLFAFKLVEYQGELWCVGLWNEAFGEYSSFADYILVIAVAFQYAPLVLIAILYIIIYLKLKSQKIPGEQSDNARQRRLQRERNILKMAIAIVLAFAVCLLPLSMAFVLSSRFVSFTLSCGFHYFVLIASLVFFSNCAINPCICFIFSGNYRQGLKNLFIS